MHSGCRALGVCLLAVLPLAAPAPAQGTDLPYASYHPALVFDWYAPAAHATAANPCVVFMHGAQGFGGSKADVNVGSASILKQHLLANGCTVMAMDFRPFPEFLLPAQLEDGAAALQHFRAHAAQ